MFIRYQFNYCSFFIYITEAHILCSWMLIGFYSLLLCTTSMWTLLIIQRLIVNMFRVVTDNCDDMFYGFVMTIYVCEVTIYGNFFWNSVMKLLNVKCISITVYSWYIYHSMHTALTEIYMFHEMEVNFYVIFDRWLWRYQQ